MVVNLQWRVQEVGDTRDLEYLLRKPIRNRCSQHRKRKVMDDKDVGVGFPRLLELKP